jgi:pyrophosphatase PpaX
VRYPNVLFDLDGTLIDSGAIILASFRHATRTVLAREIPDAELAALVGGSNIHDQMRAIDAERVEELVRVYREHNEPLHDDLEAFEGIEMVLAELKGQGRRLGIVTAKRRKTVDLAFAVLPLERYFDVVVTSDMTERHKPDPEPVLTAIGLLGATAAATAFVGDSPFDVGAGKAAGVFTVAVAWGNIHPAEHLDEAGVL